MVELTAATVRNMARAQTHTSSRFGERQKKKYIEMSAKENVLIATCHFYHLK